MEKKLRKIKVAIIIGTRPDIIKMAPVVARLKENPCFKVFIISTAQHREMFDQMLNIFPINIDFDLNIMKPNQGLAEVSSRLITRLSGIIKNLHPDIVLTQGDTTTAFMGCLAAFYNKVSVGHIEAGLRTYDKYQPFPEEINRRLISSLADLHFAPTTAARSNLLREGIRKSSIYITGNTVIDSLFAVAVYNKNQNEEDVLCKIDWKKYKIILVTVHRRENWGEPIRNICQALKNLVSLHSDILIIYPVHLNPSIKKPVFQILGRIPRIFLISPLDYKQFVSYLAKCYLVLTDSGGIQEEAPSLGKPVLVLREITERPEAVKAKVVKVIGTETGRIVYEVNKLLGGIKLYKKMAQPINLYGDGKASERIVKILLYHFNLVKKTPMEFRSKFSKNYLWTEKGGRQP